MEGKALVAVEPGPDLWMLMGGVVVENDVDGLIRRDLGVDQVQEADELLVPVALHIAPDDRPVEHVEGGEQGGRSPGSGPGQAVSLVVVGHGAETPPLYGQARLGPVQRLDLCSHVLSNQWRSHAHSRQPTGR